MRRHYRDSFIDGSLGNTIVQSKLSITFSDNGKNITYLSENRRLLQIISDLQCFVRKMGDLFAMPIGENANFNVVCQSLMGCCQRLEKQPFLLALVRNVVHERRLDHAEKLLLLDS